MVETPLDAGDGERHGQRAGLVVADRPVEDAGVGVERGVLRQAGARVRDRPAVGVAPLQGEPQMVAFAHGLIGHRGELRRRRAGAIKSEMLELTVLTPSLT